jgi:polysaccharide export outer membrane protein
MKKNRNVHYMLIALLIASSCRSPKDLIMFQEKMDNAAGIYAVSPPPKHKIKPFDNLYISVMTLDPEVNKQLNPSSLSSPNSFNGTSQMFGEPTSKYINGYIVSNDSTVTLPMLGEIKLVGLTLIEAEERVKTRADEFLKEPQIQVKLLNYRVNVSGEVRSPGLYYNYEGNISMYDAISLSQGITEFADLKHVVVKRQVENKFVTYNIDLTDNSVYNSDAFYLQPNDLVYIPPSDLKMRSANSDTYGKLLSTISTLLVAAALIFSLK